MIGRLHQTCVQVALGDVVDALVHTADAVESHLLVVIVQIKGMFQNLAHLCDGNHMVGCHRTVGIAGFIGTLLHAFPVLLQHHVLHVAGDDKILAVGIGASAKSHKSHECRHQTVWAGTLISSFLLGIAPQNQHYQSNRRTDQQQSPHPEDEL